MPDDNTLLARYQSHYDLHVDYAPQSARASSHLLRVLGADHRHMACLKTPARRGIGVKQVQKFFIFYPSFPYISDPGSPSHDVDVRVF